MLEKRPADWLAQELHDRQNPAMLERLLSEMMDATSEIVAVTNDGDGLFLYVNRSFLRASGFASEEAIGRSGLELGLWARPGERDMLYGLLEERGALEHVPWHFKTRDGRQLACLLTVKRISLSDTPCLLWLASDITRQTEFGSKPAFISRSEFRQTVETLDNLVFRLVRNPENRLVYALAEGKIAKEMGISSETVYGKTADEVIPPDLYAIIGPHLLRALDGEQTSFELDWGERTLYKTVAPLYGDGEIIGVTGSAVDITEKKRLEKLLQASELGSTLGQLAASAAHEIRNPLTAIKGFIQLIGESMDGNGIEKGRFYIDLMLTELARINHLVSEMLWLQKPKAESFQPLRVCRVLDEVLPLVYIQANLKSIQVVVRSEPSPYFIQGSADLLKQVVLNLCKNGIEAMNPGGTLTISESCANGLQTLSISDTGPGMPEEAADKLFTPFFTTKSEGNGLGLFICKKIVSDMGGRIDLQSDATGATITVSLPVLGAAR